MEQEGEVFTEARVNFWTRMKSLEQSIRLICADSDKPQAAPEADTCVTIDSCHKVTDHYNLHEKLGT